MPRMHCQGRPRREAGGPRRRDGRWCRRRGLRYGVALLMDDGPRALVCTMHPSGLGQHQPDKGVGVGDVLP